MRWKELLIYAKNLILDPSKWCQKSYAKGRYGQAITGTHPEACQWCAVGALYCAALRGSFNNRERTEAFLKLQHASWVMCPYLSPVGINDKRTHADVIKMYDLAIGEM